MTALDTALLYARYKRVQCLMCQWRSGVFFVPCQRPEGHVYSHGQLQDSPRHSVMCARTWSPRGGASGPA